MGWLGGAWFTSGEALAEADAVVAEVEATSCACSDVVAPTCCLDAPPDAGEAPASAVGEYVDDTSVEVSTAC